MTFYNELELSLEDHQVAFTEICFLLDVLTRTIGEVVGQGRASLAVNAGRQMGKKLPVHLPDARFEQVLEALEQRLAEGFGIAWQVEGNRAELRVDRCAIREVCRERQLEVGGDLCQLLHNYWSGMLSQLLGRPVRVCACQAGESCVLELETR